LAKWMICSQRSMAVLANAAARAPQIDANDT